VTSGTSTSAASFGPPDHGPKLRIGIAASTLSHHLHRLILTRLVTQERQATTLICRANYAEMDSLLGFLADECCADAVKGILAQIIGVVLALPLAREKPYG
jgi:hypothetical protein